MTPAEQRLIDATRAREACCAHCRETNLAVGEATNAREDVYNRARDAADEAYDAVVSGELLHGTGQKNPDALEAARRTHQDALEACQLSEKEYKAALKALMEEPA